VGRKSRSFIKKYHKLSISLVFTLLTHVVQSRLTKKNPNNGLFPKNGDIPTDKLKPDHKGSSSKSRDIQQHKRILVVDDNSDIAFNLRIGLETVIPLWKSDNDHNPLEG
jgi:hypothetical protein